MEIVEKKEKRVASASVRARELPRALVCFLVIVGLLDFCKRLVQKKAAPQRSKKKPKEKKMAIGTGRRMRQYTRCAFGAPPGARCGECRATEEQGAVLIAKKATRGPRYLCHTHHNANRPRPAHLAIPATANAEETEETEETEKTEEPEAPEKTEKQEEGHLEYIATDPWDARTAKSSRLPSRLRGGCRTSNRFALLPKKGI